MRLARFCSDRAPHRFADPAFNVELSLIHSCGSREPRKNKGFPCIFGTILIRSLRRARWWELLNDHGGFSLCAHWCVPRVEIARSRPREMKRTTESRASGGRSGAFPAQHMSGARNGGAGRLGMSLCSAGAARGGGDDRGLDLAENGDLVALRAPQLDQNKGFPCIIGTTLSYSCRPKRQSAAGTILPSPRTPTARDSPTGFESARP